MILIDILVYLHQYLSIEIENNYQHINQISDFLAMEKVMSTRLKIITALFFLIASNATFASGTAFWTGKSRPVQTVTYQTAWECEYNYNGQYFTKVFQSTCPSSVTIETPSGSNYQSTQQSYNSGYSAKAYFTGRSDTVQDANYQTVWRCEYNYNGQLITKLFQNTCPSNIDVR